MKEHAIPQDITGYKFHIVGNMTLKQFAEVALGVVAAFFIYKTNLYFPIKWALIAFSASFGAALAFLPIEERPLDHWFITFFTILYKPTKFYWKRKPKVPDFFSYKPSDNTKSSEKEIDLTPQRRQSISEYLQSVKNIKEDDQTEIYYRQRSNQILSIFTDQSLKIDYLRSEKAKQRPNLRVKTRSLIGSKENSLENTEENIVFDFAGYQDAINTETEKRQQEIRNYEEIRKRALLAKDVAAEVVIPESKETRVEENYKKEREALGKEILNKQPTQEAAYLDGKTETTQTAKNTSSATTNKDLPFPTKPSKPNKLVGMILTQNNELVNNATLTIKDSSGKPVTAIKSNALGQFFITSQLNNGLYKIEVTKNNLSFSPLSINLEGKIIEPLEIRSNE